MPYLSFAAICLLFGSNFILMSRATQAFGPMAIGAGRVFGAIVVLLVMWRWLTPAARVPREKWLSCLFVGLLANGYPYVVQPYLIGTAKAMGGGAGHSFFGMMVAFTPLLTILVSIPMLGIRPTARQLVGVLGGLAFITLLMYDGSVRGVTPMMLAMTVSIPLCYATANTYLRAYLNDVPALALSVTMLVSPVVLLTPLALFDGVLEPFHLAGPAEPTNWPTAIAAVVMLGFLGTGLTMWLFVRLVQSQGPLFAGMVTYVVPLVALAWGSFDAEQITTRQLVAIAGVLSMVALVQFGAAKTKPANTALPDSASATAEV
ncbi:MAG: EamA family transporter [Planctomycetota bacterium]